MFGIIRRSKGTYSAGKKTLKTLLAREYSELHRFSESIQAYETVLVLMGNLPGLFYEKTKIFFELGTTYLQSRNYSQALENYRIAIQWKQKTGNEYQLGNSYHQIGMVFQEQRKWEEALEYYSKALFFHWNFPLHGQKEIMVASLRRILAYVPGELAQEQFETVFHDLPEEQKESCRAVIFQNQAGS